LIKVFLVFQVIASIDLPEAVECYMQTFSRILAIADTAPARLSRAAFPVRHTGISNLAVGQTPDHSLAVLTATMYSLQSRDPTIVERALYLARTVFTRAAGSLFVESFAPLILEMIDGLLSVPTGISDENVLEDVFTTLAVFLASLARTTGDLVDRPSISIGERLETTFTWTSPLATRQRLAIADVVQTLALRNDDSMDRFVEPYLALLLRSWDAENPEANLLNAMAAVFQTNRIRLSEEFGLQSMAFGAEALRNGNRHVVTGAAQMIGQVVITHQGVVIDILVDVLEPGGHQLVNYESDPLVVAAILDMISCIVMPASDDRYALASVLFPVRQAVMELFAAVATTIQGMRARAPSRALPFAGLLRGSAGMAPFSMMIDRRLRPGVFLAASQAASESLPKVGMDHGLDDEIVVLGFRVSPGISRVAPLQRGDSST
jgi:hypothetical protein